MGIFSKKIGPVFIKETSDAVEFIEKLKVLQGQNKEEELAKKIERQIKLAQYGEMGENNIAYELKNSGMDMYILHDIYLETDDLSAQIDYIVITRKHVYIIECKNLIGDIEIDNTGAFIRSYSLAGKKIKEGIYSPITQNQRHLQVLKEIRKQSKNNIVTKMMFERYFDSTYKSIVVLTNSKTCLKANYAPKLIKEQVIRADRLVAYMKEKDELSKEQNMSVDNMLALAQFFLEQNKPERSDYSKKYEKLVSGVNVESTMEKMVLETVEEQKKVQEEKTFGLEREELICSLKKYRLEQSRKENVKPYYIFNDVQMNDLVEKYPQSKEGLLKVSGFGKVKVEKYGDEILQILQGHKKV